LPNLRAIVKDVLLASNHALGAGSGMFYLALVAVLATYPVAMVTLVIRYQLTFPLTHYAVGVCLMWLTAIHQAYTDELILQHSEDQIFVPAVA